VKSRAEKLARWIALGEKVLDDSHTGYIEVYAKDGNFLHGKYVSRELIELEFEDKGTQQTGR
jgi:hypothetical protein